MGEDAAAAARRIVEEVLAARGTASEEVADASDRPSPETGTDDADESLFSSSGSEDVSGVEDVDAGSPASAARPEPARRQEAGERSAVHSEAERIARRIVDEVLAAEADVRVRGVPREGLAADDERTAKIVVDPEPSGEATQRVPGGSGASAAGPEDPTGPGTDGAQGAPDHTPEPQPEPEGDDTATRAASPEDEPTSDPDSAQDIVRRIVAEVQAGAQPAPAEDTDDETAETVHLPTPPPDPRSPEKDDAGASPGTVELPVGMTARSGDPETAIAEEEGTTQVVPRTGRKREAPSESESGPVALADDAESGPGRPLVGWAPPPEPEPTQTAIVEDPAPRTLRWLLASLLGAVALAVLFPLAVAALRALVSLG